MDEFKTNATLRIAAIALAIFVVVGTIAIFAFPDDDPNPSGTPGDIATASAPDRTRVATRNATALASTPASGEFVGTPVAGQSSSGTPTPGAAP